MIHTKMWRTKVFSGMWAFWSMPAILWNSAMLRPVNVSCASVLPKRLNRLLSPEMFVATCKFLERRIIFFNKPSRFSNFLAAFVDRKAPPADHPIHNILGALLTAPQICFMIRVSWIRWIENWHAVRSLLYRHTILLMGIPCGRLFNLLY